MSEEQTKQEFVDKEPQKKKTTRKKTEKKKSPIEAAIVGRYCTFYGTVGSGIETMDGVPMEINADPDGRHVVMLFSSDGARAFLYLDQVASFTTQPQAPEQQPKSPGFNFDMNQQTPQSGPAEGAGQEYYTQQPGQAVDEVYYNSRRGQTTPRRTERVSE